MEEGKTGALLWLRVVDRCACWPGPPTPTVEALAAFGRQLGTGLPGGRRHARDLGGARSDRQAGRQRPAVSTRSPSRSCRRWPAGTRCGRARSAAGGTARRRRRAPRAASCSTSAGAPRDAGHRRRQPARPRPPWPAPPSALRPAAELLAARPLRGGEGPVTSMPATPPLPSPPSMRLDLDPVGARASDTTFAGPSTDRAAGALGRAVDALGVLQHADGWWKGELETNVTMDAEDLLLRQFLGIRTAEQTESSAAVDPLQSATGRHVGQLLRRPVRPLDHGRGLRGAAPGRRPGRRPPHAGGRRVRARRGRSRADPGVHPDLVGALRPVALGRAAGAAARDHALAAVVPAQHLRLRMLGPPDRRRPDGGLARTGRFARSRSASTSCACGTPDPPRRSLRTWAGRFDAPRPGAARLRAPAAAGPCDGPLPERGRALDRASARRPTARGAGSSRPGCTR